jgi:type III pantothenate kinase
MLLAIDAGNTNIKLGVFQQQRLLTSWRMPTDASRSADEYGTQLRNLFEQASMNAKDVEAIIVASVVPQLNATLKLMSERYLQSTPIFVDHTTNTGLKLLYDEPSELGADRIVGAVAAAEKYGAPCIVIDFGTATTFNAINSNREYLGGIIVPGIMTCADALFSRTAKLPRVPIARPKNVIGKSTVDALQSGIFYGYGNLVDGLLEQMLPALEGTPKIIATGGLARVIDEALHFIYEFDQNLTLDGLRIVYDINRGT